MQYYHRGLRRDAKAKQNSISNEGRKGESYLDEAAAAGEGGGGRFAYTWSVEKTFFPALASKFYGQIR